MIKIKKNKALSKLILLSIAILLILCILQVSSAADISINNATSGGINGAISSANSGDTILLATGNYTGTNNRGIAIDKNITIKGNGPSNQVIIDAQRQDRIFTISENITATFINITFINGKTTGNG
jgi:hypothetical protein